jgi:hypothetical protein
MDAQHRLDREWRAATQRLMRAASVRPDQRHQISPGHHLVHLVEEDFLAGLLGQRVEAKSQLGHGLNVSAPSGAAPVQSR